MASSAQRVALRRIVLTGYADEGGSRLPSTPGPPMSALALSYRLVEEFGRLWSCDPDESRRPRSGPTGAYVADGIAFASTLRP